MGIWPFNAADQTHQQYAQAYQNGSYGNLPPQQVAQDYQQFLQTAPPEVVQNVHQQYFQQMPQNERAGLFSGLLGGLQQQGVNTQQYGYGNINPQQANPSQLGGLFNMAQSSGVLGNLLGGGQGGSYGQQGGQQSLLSNPLAQMAISGIMSYAMNRAMNGGLQGLMGGGQSQQQQPQVTQQPQQTFNTGGGDF